MFRIRKSTPFVSIGSDAYNTFIVTCVNKRKVASYNYSITRFFANLFRWSIRIESSEDKSVYIDRDSFDAWKKRQLQYVNEKEMQAIKEKDIAKFIEYVVRDRPMQIAQKFYLRYSDAFPVSDFFYTSIYNNIIEEIHRELEAAGYKLTDFLEDPDVYKQMFKSQLLRSTISIYLQNQIETSRVYPFGIFEDSSSKQLNAIMSRLIISKAKELSDKKTQIYEDILGEKSTFDLISFSQDLRDYIDHEFSIENITLSEIQKFPEAYDNYLDLIQVDYSILIKKVPSFFEHYNQFRHSSDLK